MSNKFSGLLFSLMLVILTACDVMPIELPLAEDRPTFIFFYTDG